MAGHGFHAHGIHEHEIEQQAHKGVSLSQYVAIFTAILSTIAAVVGYHSSSSQNEALMLKNKAVIMQNLANDQWSFYQSKSNKQHLSELASQLVTSNRAKFYEQEAQRYFKEKNEIRAKAESLEKISAQANAESEQIISSHHQESQGMMLLQIAISLASITALTRKKWLFSVAAAAAAIGTILSIIAWFT